MLHIYIHNAYYMVAVVYHTLDLFYMSAMQYTLEIPSSRQI
jgi:hypothetical protein